MQWLFLVLLQQSNDDLQELKTTSASQCQVRLDDGPPQHVCLKCERKLLRRWRAMLKIAVNDDNKAKHPCRQKHSLQLQQAFSLFRCEGHRRASNSLECVHKRSLHLSTKLYSCGLALRDFVQWSRKQLWIGGAKVYWNDEPNIN